MLILGLVLITVGGLAIVSAVFASEIDGGKLQLLGQDIGTVAFFLVGVGSAVAIWWGLSLFRMGSKRSWARRKEQKRLTDLSEQLDSVDAQRRNDVDRQEDKDRPSL
jgi:membrane protease YdiL (CAAX protease family)